MRSPDKLSFESRLSWLAGLGMSLLSLAVYVLTLAPTVSFIDSGELITVGVQGGIAHPPGYPLYSLLAVIGARLPFSDPAVGVNLVSAVGGALAVGLFYALVYEIVRRHLHLPSSARSTPSPAPGARGSTVPADGRGNAGGGAQPRSPKSRTQKAGSQGYERQRAEGATQTSSTLVAERQPPTPRSRPAEATYALVSTQLPPDRYAIAVAAGTALLLGASYTFWSWSTQAKMYSLHFAFVAGLFTLALRARRAVDGAGDPGPLWPPWLLFSIPRPWPVPARRLLLLAFAWGLALTNHTLTFLLLPSLAIILLRPPPLANVGAVREPPVPRPARQRVNRRDVAPRPWSARFWRWLVRYVRWLVSAGFVPLWRWLVRYLPWLVLAVLVPLLLYLYLPLRSAQQPLLNWGSPSTWGDFWRHVTVQQYSVLIGQQLPGGLPAFRDRTVELTVRQLGPWLSVPALLLAALGVVRLARSALPLLVATALLVIIALVQTYNFQNPEFAAYSVHMFMMFMAWVGIGLYEVGNWILNPRRQSVQNPSPEIQNPKWLALLPLGLAVLALLWNAGRAGHANDYMAEAFIQNHFNNYAPRAIVITNNWFFVSPSYYWQYVRGQRPDVAVINRKLLDKPFYFNYVMRQYPDVMAPVKDLAEPFGEITRRWWSGEKLDKVEEQRLSILYWDMIHTLITKNLAAGRPVYLHWHNPGPEEAYIARGLSTHPEGLALRVDPQPFTGPPPDPNFDWRGILTDVVPKDEISRVVIADYPVALDRLAAYARKTNHPSQAARFAEEAAQVRAAIGR